MDCKTIYQELTKKLGMEHSPLIPRIWQLLCNEQEAAVVNATPARLEELAARLQIAPPEMERILAGLFRKGVIFEQEKEGTVIYRMPRHIVQFHDATSLWPEAPRALFDLWARFMEEEYPQIPAFMTQIQASAFLRVIPVQESVASESQVLPYEDAVQIVSGANRLAVTNCPCRLIARKCDRPLEVCLQLNRGADYTIKRGTGREITAAEAKEILRLSAGAGLVHMTENRAGIGNVICNCCTCCCIALPYARNPATKKVVQASRFRALLDESLCVNCADCGKICPMEAIVTRGADLPQFLGERCLGCGLCTRVCPTAAVSLAEASPDRVTPA